MWGVEDHQADRYTYDRLEGSKESQTAEQGMSGQRSPSTEEQLRSGPSGIQGSSERQVAGEQRVFHWSAQNAHSCYPSRDGEGPGLWRPGGPAQLTQDLWVPLPKSSIDVHKLRARKGRGQELVLCRMCSHCLLDKKTMTRTQAVKGGGLRGMMEPRAWDDGRTMRMKSEVRGHLMRVTWCLESSLSISSSG